MYCVQEISITWNQIKDKKWIRTYLSNQDRMHWILMKNSEQINGKHRAGLSEQHELGELPADDEQGGGARNGQHVLPAWPVQ